ncbi:MAG: PilZ domain-containing protein [Proteobacteria bacterium]|nr:PilZ domain-containing protein [Pseudomonadota bacterium]
MATTVPRLRVEFADAAEFCAEYASNLSKGGVFFPTDDTYTLRQQVQVDLVLSFCGETVELRGEIVHRVSPQMASAGGTAGVAVQFQAAPKALRDRLEPYLAYAPADAPERPERRAAPRDKARVQAKVETESQDLQARTRNLSQSGVLVNVSGEPLPVGDAVTLTLSHPTSGERMRVAGRVVRHQTGADGQVQAMAIQFRDAAGNDESVEEFVSDVAAAEHSRHLGGIHGEIGEVGIENLLQMFGSCSPHGTVTLSREGEEGFVAFENGMLRGVVLGSVRGQKALARMLTWREGQFEFHARVDSEQLTDAGVPLGAAILDAMRVLDESRRAAAPVSPEAVLSVESTLLDAQRSELSKTEEAVVDLAMVGMTVAKVVEVIPETDNDVLAAVESLRERGIVNLDR